MVFYIQANFLPSASANRRKFLMSIFLSTCTNPSKSWSLKMEVGTLNFRIFAHFRIFAASLPLVTTPVSLGPDSVLSLVGMGGAGSWRVRAEWGVHPGQASRLLDTQNTGSSGAGWAGSEPLLSGPWPAINPPHGEDQPWHDLQAHARFTLLMALMEQCIPHFEAVEKLRSTGLSPHN